jgi:hypothetical protein
VFIDRVFTPLVRDFPELKMVFEHITTAEAADFVARAPTSPRRSRRSTSIINRNAMFAGGLRPHAYCLPVAKREEHRLAVRRAATSGSPKFFLGTDSAPHAVERKESACGCAGIFNAPFALESYAAVFEEEGALDRLRRPSRRRTAPASTACRSTRRSRSRNGARKPPRAAPEAVAAPKAPASTGAASDAATALRLYYDHLEAGRYEAAFELREPGEADAAAFAAHFRRFASQKVSIGLPSIPVEGKGWLYVEVPVQTYGTMTDGTPFGSAGTVTLRRRASGGDWRIYTK